jgi:tetratricopeptide (TPR) repeat protein
MFDRAVAVLHLAEADPGRSVRPATELARAARRAGDHAAASVAERALGIAALHLRDTDIAARHLRAAATLGRRAGAPTLVAEARLRLAAVLNVRGRSAAALREIAAAVQDFAGLDRARALAQQGAILLQLGRYDPALDSLTRALPELRAAGDDMWLKRVLANRGLVHARRLQFDAAEADLLEAERLNRRLGLDLSVAFIQQNLGWVNTLRGDVPRALSYLDRAEETLRRLGAQVGLLLEDRAALLLSAGLVTEALDAARRSVAALERERQRIALPDVRLLLARAAILDGDPALGLAAARSAVSELVRQRRPEWVPLARFAVAACRAAGPDRPRLRLAALHRTADQLEAAGWRAIAVEARILAAGLAAERGGSGRAQLQRAGRERHRGTAALRALGWHAEALLRLADDRRPGALLAVASGLRVLDEHRAGLGAADLRAHTGRHRVALAELGLRIAVAGGRPGQILTWAEHGRASHLLLPPVQPPDDDLLAADLAELRATVREPEDPGRRRRQVTLEHRIRDRARRRPGTPGAPGRPVDVPRLAAALGDAALVEYVEMDGAYSALTVIDGRPAWQPLGPVTAIRDLVDRLPFALRRLAAGRGGSPGAARLLDDAAGRLEAALLAPFLSRIGDRPLVVVPTGRLQAIPWPVLPSCAGRPVTVAPSATTWHAAGQPALDGPHRTVVVAGPGLPGAEQEAEAVAALHGTAALTGPAATVDGVLGALTGAAVAHLATHGRVHPDHPLFSALTLADGPLTAYDLERLRPAPALVVLAGCDTGRHTVRAGDELLGLAATLLACGTRQIVASMVPVPDAATAPLMIAFHKRLAAGASAAEALAAAQQQTGDATGFICIGGSFTLTP